MAISYEASSVTWLMSLRVLLNGTGSVWSSLVLDACALLQPLPACPF